jgi:hypothetical protein
VESTREQAGASAAAPGPNGGNGCTPSHALSVIAHAAPDLDPDTSGVQVPAGTMVQLTGRCEDVRVTADCDVTTNPVSNFRWSLTFAPPAGGLSDVTSLLTGPGTLNPRFVARDEGTYRATLRGEHPTLGVRSAQVAITAGPAPTEVRSQTGTITFLRVHELETGFGPQGDSINVEAVIRLSTAPADAFGFQLRNDRHRPSRAGMLDLLRDAFFHNHPVTIEYSIVPGRHNGYIIRVELTA